MLMRMSEKDKIYKFCKYLESINLENNIEQNKIKLLTSLNFWKTVIFFL